MTDYSRRVGLTDETEKLLKAAKTYVREELEGDLQTRDFRAGNNTISTDEVLNFALTQLLTGSGYDPRFD